MRKKCTITGNLEFFVRLGTIPIVALEQGVNANAYLPFSEVLDWNKALIITTTKGLQVKKLKSDDYFFIKIYDHAFRLL